MHNPYMPAPFRLVHSHSHSLRIASGVEALVLRVRTSDGAIGFGFTLNLDPRPARDMAGWDAWARHNKLPLWQILGVYRRPIALRRTSGEEVDPWKLGSVDALRAARPRLLLAPHAHPWEVAWCATLAASFTEDAAIALPGEPPAASVELPLLPGNGIDWSYETGFAGINWNSADHI